MLHMSGIRKDAIIFVNTVDYLALTLDEIKELLDQRTSGPTGQK